MADIIPFDRDSDDGYTPPAGLPLTEDLAALMFAQRYDGQLAYCHDRGAWFEHDGSIWRDQRTPKAFHYARELSRRLSVSDGTPKVSLQKAKFASEVERFARADPIFARTSDHWDRDDYLLGTPEGTVDLRTGRLRPANPGDFITKSTACPPARWADCPMWLEFLRQATGDDEELVKFLQQIAGYALTGSTREHALFFVYGPGGNGKSVFLNTLNHIIGDYAEVASMETFTTSRGGQIPADLAALRGARLVTASETGEGKKWDQQRVASVTGGDKITARFMRQNFFTYVPQFTLVIVGNHKPALSSIDDAMRRRFNIIPFIIKPQNPDRELEEKLKAEWPAILRWMIDGCLDWQVNGLQRPLIVSTATDEYFEEQNTMQQWLDQECEVDFRNSHLMSMSSELFTSWSRFAKDSGDEPGNARTFKSAMEKMGFRFKKDRTGRWFYLVRLKQKERREYDDDDTPF